MPILKVENYIKKRCVAQPVSKPFFPKMKSFYINYIEIN